ncbi:MAG: ATP-binding protein [Acidobacteriota bacterium]
MGKLVELSPENLRRTCDPAKFSFETTASLPVLGEVLGQPRAVAALEFGSRVASHGFNLFALGLPGSGKTTLIREYLERDAATQPVPPDLCYVYNFANARSPIPLRLPPGQAVRFKAEMEKLVEELRTTIPRAFDTAEYSSQRDKVVKELEEKRQKELSQLEQLVSQSGFQLVKTPTGLLLAPALEGKLLTDEDLDRLTPEEREKVTRVRDRLQREIEDRLRRAREFDRSAREAVVKLDNEIATYATRHLIDDLRARYSQEPAVLQFLEALQADVIDNLDAFRKGKEAEAPQLPFLQSAMPASDRLFSRYEVNVLVDNGHLKGAPVVVETNPTYHNLCGRIEHQATWGGVFTDHTMIKSGALHRANGGYLIVPARECLLSPLAWEGLKRALKDSAIRIEEVGAQMSLVSTVTLTPEAVPLQVKTVLIGNPLLYHLLYSADEDFQKLFKVKTEFTTRMVRTTDSEQSYALFVSTIAKLEKTLPFDRGAVARIVEYGSRAAADQDQLSTRFGDIADLIREAAHRASRNAHGTVTAEDVKATEEARRYRQNLAEERYQELLLKETLLVDTSGTAVGRVNGLSVSTVGDFAFGHPVRITATVGPGRRGVLSIEREVELSGPIHGKGVLILSGYLLRKYAQNGPLGLSASLVFEQSYGMVEGDSASLAELCVLLSVLAQRPLRQDVAVTGSVNQHGGVQPVGGVNEKIEGFFDLCRARGLTGTQGVLIPSANRSNLMLRDDILDAVRSGQFHVWTAEEVDDALRLLTGAPVGEPDDSGSYPEGSLHQLVSSRLDQFIRTLRSLSGEEKKGE